MKRELRDEEMWVNGMYTMEAFRVVLTNAFSQKGAKPVEYRDKSLLQEIKDKNRVLTEEEKQEIRAGSYEYGFEEGMTKKSSEIAKNLLSSGVAMEIIVSATGLSEEEVKALA